jgi:CheY-like chemotaxis protein
MATLKNESKILEFLEKARVLVVDKSTSSRTRLAKTLSDLGCKNHNIIRVGHLQEAMTAVNEKMPDLIMSDYVIGGGSGFDLFKQIRDLMPFAKNTVMILVTSNISQSAVAKAAEEDVDAFIVKPYTIASLRQNMLQAIDAKLFPSAYIIKIEAGKKLLFDGNYAGSYEIFVEASKLSKSPSLALYYMGTAKKLMEEKEAAVNSYEKGLSYNHIHFKCQIGLFEMFMRENRYFDAYEIVKRIAKYFPSNPERLQQVVRLAVITENYHDIEFYYEIFKSLDERDQITLKYICAGLYILGKYLMTRGDNDKALEVFEKIGVSCEGNPTFLRSIIEVLFKYNSFDHALNYLGRFDAGASETVDYKISQLLTNYNNLTAAERVTRALELYNLSDRSYTMYKVLITSMVENDLSERAQKYMDEALVAFPKMKTELNQIMQIKEVSKLA